MPKSSTSLNQLLYEIRRIEAHREILTNKKIEKIYQSLLKDLNAYLAEEYLKYADEEGRMYLSYLNAENHKARFLQEIINNVDKISPALKSEIASLIDEVYTESYKGMLKALKKAEKSNDFAKLGVELAVNPNVLKRAINNNISKLTLPTVLQRHRADIIYQIQQELNIGLMNGDRYETMANRIAEKVNISQSKAMNITRTETHRNIEGGYMDCAENIQEGLDGSELVYTATWRTMKDERVRPQQRRKTKSGWKTSISRNGANHMKMEGEVIKVGDFFDLGNGVKTKAPSQSGNAANDCNCRCYLEYKLMTIKELEKASGKPVTVASVHGSVKTQMNEQGISNASLQRTTDAKAFDGAIKDAISSRPVGACVDAHPLDELKDFKLFLSENKMSGVAVKPDGDITAVFKNAGFKQGGVVNDLIITARENGGVKMDCYGQYLVNSYERCGYVPVARIPFNPNYVDDPYLLKTKPDVYALMKNTDDIEEVIEKNAKNLYKLSTQDELDNLPTFDYDEALEYRDKLLMELLS